MTDTLMKCCSKKGNCIHPDGPMLPATNEYFGKDKRQRSGLKSYCRPCEARAAKEYRERHPERVKQACKDYADSHREELRAYWRDYDAKRHEEKLAYQQEYVHPDPEKRRANQRKRYHADPEYEKEIKRKWREANPEKYRASRKARNLRRISREHSVISDFTPEDWIIALEYFGNCCAACGRQLNGMFHKAAPDHWIPITKGGGTTRSNIVPLCHGQGGCNNGKADKDAHEWLTRKFGKRKAVVIEKRVEAYFEWLNTNGTT